ncbi:hypothetical protein LOTGIDRAFT_234882 [Lottia gigantea]|uniref:Peptidase S1 domain-containing protein n=1 Tax=Lottia gigantea TaxID=225164 RepID=V3ZU68_LOTGI|nr:hypothetical protein LOTGIDRAFT_234882 [Lottia gigantea]ESO87897.1 hypothetical protein LOTGIDRAFT_234882 [Lottia gigantea]
MNTALILLACVTAVFCEEESRHSVFYNYYRPPPPVRRPTYYHYTPTYYQRPTTRNLYLSENCCSLSESQAAGCQTQMTWFGVNVCRCCVKDISSYNALQTACNAALSAATATSATTPAPAAATTAATTATTAATTTTTTAATTTTTTTAAPTTTAPTKFCPNSGCSRKRRSEYGFFKSLRIEGGTPVSSTCDYPGVVGLEATAPTGDVITVCTGVLTSATTIQIPSNCAETLALPLAENDVAVVDGKKIPISTVSSDKPLATVTLSTPVDINAAPSQGCIYDTSMGAYDKSTCEIVGYGVDASNAKQTVPQTAKVTFDALACKNIDTTLTIPEATYGCATLDNAAACAGDGGALITCDLVTTGEKVVVGQAETFDCNTGTPAVYFQNFDA